MWVRCGLAPCKQFVRLSRSVLGAQLLSFLTNLLHLPFPLFTPHRRNSCPYPQHRRGGFAMASTFNSCEVVASCEQLLFDSGPRKLRAVVVDDSTSYMEVICALLEL